MADRVGSNGERTVFNVVGKPNIPGRLSYVIATGKAKFGSDATVPNMLFAKFLRSPYGHAKIKSLDISKAKALPGVVDIVTWEDPDIRALPACYGGSGISHSMAHTQLIICAVENAIGKWITTPPITPDKVLKALGKA
jgi:CO/xanthine dehydrogenase Mo-binding subunit